MAIDLSFSILFIVNTVLLIYLFVEKPGDSQNIKQAQKKDSQLYVIFKDGHYDVLFKNSNIGDESFETDFEYKLAKIRVIQSLPFQKQHRGPKIVENQELMEEIPNHIPIFSEKSNMVDLNYNIKEYQEMVKSDWAINNPIAKLGYYKDKLAKEHYNNYPNKAPDFTTPHMGIFNDPNYCHVHDNFVLNNPEVILDQMYFLSDYHPLSIPRYFGLGEFGIDTNPKVSKDMNFVNWHQRLFPMDPRTSIFFTKNYAFHYQHNIGTNFACWGQSYNHVPGHGLFTRKDLIVTTWNKYLKKWKKFELQAKNIENGGERVDGSALPIGATVADVKKCYNETSIFPTSYRLHYEKECKKYFEIINSENYKKKKEKSEIQYILKIGFGVERAIGIYLIDDQTERNLIANYSKGEKCGQIKENLVAQEYLQNPLTIYGGHKFDFRVYMLIVSVDPLIIYYHDGFLRVSLFKYDKQVINRKAHLTNTEIAKEIFKKVEKEGGTHMGMNIDQLRDFQMASLKSYQEYLIKNELKIDKDWVEKKLKHAFKTTLIHLIKTVEKDLYKKPDLFAIFGVDFMLDEDYNSYLIELNDSPAIIGTSKEKTALMKSFNKGTVQIILAYIRSRVKRSIKFLKQHAADIKNNLNLEQLSIDFRKLNTNYLEPEYEHMVQNTTWEIVVDENKKGANAYYGYVKEECISMMISE